MVRLPFAKDFVDGFGFEDVLEIHTIYIPYPFGINVEPHAEYYQHLEYRRT